MTVEVRAIRAADNAAMAAIIYSVLADEFDESRAEVDAMLPECADLAGHYSGSAGAYFVATDGDALLGGAGIAPLAVAGDARRYCELQKMYLAGAARGRGVGQRLLDRCLEFARAAGYSHCYLDTREEMQAAIALYRRNGFERLPAPLADTGHFICDAFFLRPL